jgi:hypothetical protein
MTSKVNQPGMQSMSMKSVRLSYDEPIAERGDVVSASGSGTSSEKSATTLAATRSGLKVRRITWVVLSVVLVTSALILSACGSSPQHAGQSKSVTTTTKPLGY